MLFNIQYQLIQLFKKFREGLNPEFSTKDKHLRECFVVVKDGFDNVTCKEK